MAKLITFLEYPRTTIKKNPDDFHKRSGDINNMETQTVINDFDLFCY